MEAEDLLDKFAQDEGFGNWDTVVLNCHHSVIRSVAIAAVNQALRQPPIVVRSEQLICPCCGSDKTYKTDAIHCNRCAVTTEI